MNQDYFKDLEKRYNWTSKPMPIDEWALEQTNLKIEYDTFYSNLEKYIKFKANVHASAKLKEVTLFNEIWQEVWI